MRTLRCRGLSREPFFRSVDLDLGAGETVVLHGPSGSGKTLFLRGLADLDPTDAGTVTLDDVERRDLSAPAWRRRVLYVDGSAPRFPGTVADNLARTARLREEQAVVSADLPSLEPTADAERLSSGQAQLLALHRALAVGPEVLLLDEVTSALDPDAAARVERVLDAWKGDERALLWVSHDAALADRLGARRTTLP